MTSPTITVNSTRPTTFVEAPLATTATFAVAALAVVILGVTQTMGAAASARAAGLLRQAETMPRGSVRDRMLASAHAAAVDALDLAPKDGEVRARAARALYLQATTAMLDEVSAPLLDAAEREAHRARIDSPDNAGAPATLAMIAFARADGQPTPAMADLVAQSYAGRARDAEAALWRTQAAAAAWPALAPGAKIAASDEACALLKLPHTRERAQPAAARMGDELGDCRRR
jgi:hypothetical protein